MIVFGAVDFAAALVRAGKFLGHHVTVCDARSVFATAARFPEADEVVVDWPHRYLRRTRTDARTVLCVLTHEARFDVPLLTEALRMPAAFIGAMGSRRTHEDRTRRLREAGVSDGELARLRSPIGLDLGARTPEETALSIAAEIVAARRGGTGRPLTGERSPSTASRGPGERSPPTARTAPSLRAEAGPDLGDDRGDELVELLVRGGERQRGGLPERRDVQVGVGGEPVLGTSPLRPSPARSAGPSTRRTKDSTSRESRRCAASAAGSSRPTSRRSRRNRSRLRRRLGWTEAGGVSSSRETSRARGRPR